MYIRYLDTYARLYGAWGSRIAGSWSTGPRFTTSRPTHRGIHDRATVRRSPRPPSSCSQPTIRARGSRCSTGPGCRRGGDRQLLVSDHVVFGEHLDAYGRPEIGGSGWQAAHRARRALARAADGAVGRRRHHDAGPARHEHPHRGAAPAGRAGQDGLDARRAVGRPARPRRRRRLAAGGVRGRRADVRGPRPPARPHAGGVPDAVARAARPSTRPTSRSRST